jgi:hypothetical protein
MEVKPRLMVAESSIRETIADRVAGMPVVNHHEHAWASFSLTYGPLFDLPSLMCQTYSKDDLAAAGFERRPDLFVYLETESPESGSAQTWSEIRPSVDAIRSTAYYRNLLRCLDALFGITEAEILGEHWQAASDRILRYSQENRGRGADLCERMGITTTILDTKTDLRKAALELGNHRLLWVTRLSQYIHEHQRPGLAVMLEEHPAADFEEWLGIFDGLFEQALEAGAVGIKCGMAYSRSIEYGDTPRDRVARIFERGILTAAPQEKVDYQDYMVNRPCRLCTEADVPLQLHAGIQAGQRHTLEDTRPTLLTSLFQRHGDLRFDLFHGGYPWTTLAGLMAKYSPNVYIDGCWLAHISPSAYRAALTSWIETVPSNKIFAWGGDHVTLELSYGSLLLAKDAIVDVLTDPVKREYFDIDLALYVARRILQDNAMAFWWIE